MRPIWESSSRPLFVRSVWLETANAARSHRRHFILDYQPRERQRWTQRQKLGRRRGTQSYELCEQEADCEDSFDYLEDYLLLDATKLTLQQQQQQQQQQEQEQQAAHCKLTSGTVSRYSRHAKRRAWLLSRGKNYNLPHSRGQLADSLLEPYSRRSSLQDLHSTLSNNTSINPEERLAERVLNWLDLAGRKDIVKSELPMVASSAQLPRSGAQRSQKHAHVRLKLESGEPGRRGGGAPKRAPTAHPRSQSTRKSAKAAATQPPPLPPANAKPITIIFNKEGVPVRLNRAARNIDLCALSHSASTTRRLAGQLASARLYNGATPSPRAHQQQQPHLESSRTPPHSGRGLASAVDSKKQLHIFMPSLPKKGLLSAVGSSEDGQQSSLSVTFSELCQI
ncbi:uncharacterized protein LOC115626165 [Scaptodrosophila lebanonensis]|uniref:Uncharacterized protein LOC115626165 n=1 Tax=Drosophila lebanonensis TaxID=7225 RepID=A0A6J2TQC0_DROLE|nr:uncharacterized protein LOC115626165 [Scaptodrosophila lebanonensis]